MVIVEATQAEEALATLFASSCKFALSAARSVDELLELTEALVEVTDAAVTAAAAFWLPLVTASVVVAAAAEVAELVSMVMYTVEVSVEVVVRSSEV